MKVKIYNINDQRQYRDEIRFWDSKTAEYKLSTLEVLRIMWTKFENENKNNDGFGRFRRVLKITKQK